METNNDRGSVLKQVLEKRQGGQLPSNFTFRMMEQIRVETMKREKKKRIIMLFSLLASLLVIIGSFIFCLFFYLDFKLSDMLPPLKVSAESMSLIGFYSYIALLALFLLGIDLWVRKKKSIFK